MQVGIVQFLSTQIQDADWSRTCEHILQGLKFEVQIILQRGATAACSATSCRAGRGHGPCPLVLLNLSGALRILRLCLRRRASLSLAKILHTALGLRYLLLEFVDGLLNMRDVVGQLAFRAVITEELDLAVGNLAAGLWCWRIAISRQWDGLCAQSDGNSLDSLGVTEISRKKVESDGNVAFGSAIRTRGPNHRESVKRGCIQLDSGPFVVALSWLPSLHIFDSLQLPASLVSFVGAPPLLPQAPTNPGLLSLLVILERHTYKCPIPSAGDNGKNRSSVHNGQRIGLALVEVCHGDLVGLLDHCRRGIQGSMEAKLFGRGRHTMAHGHTEVGWLEAHHGRRLRVKRRVQGAQPAVARVRVQRRAILIHGLIAGILVHERGGRIRGLLRRRLDEGVKLLVEVVRRHALVLVEVAHVHHGGPRMHGTFARGHGQRSAQAHAETQRGRVQVASLRVVDGVGAAGSGRVVTRRLVGKGRE